MNNNLLAFEIIDLSEIVEVSGELTMGAIGGTSNGCGKDNGRCLAGCGCSGSNGNCGGYCCDK